VLKNHCWTEKHVGGGGRGGAAPALPPPTGGLAVVASDGHSGHLPPPPTHTPSWTDMRAVPASGGAWKEVGVLVSLQGHITLFFYKSEYELLRIMCYKVQSEDIETLDGAEEKLHNAL
jgi:hypothetical protein